jgi:tetratricopeptide (TPR) repeat protein
MSRLSRILAACGLFLINVAAGAAALVGSAEIVSLQGSGQYRMNAQSEWDKAKQAQRLFTGNFVRTDPYSRMAILLADNTQVRLNEKSLLEILEVQDVKRTQGQTRFRQLVGRAWVQSKTLPRDLTWETPTGTIGIRGTDWEIDVAEDGRSLLTVLSGEIDFYNSLGRLVVRANEQAVIEPGKAPVKIVVQNPRDRVQWVTAHMVEPMRFIRLDGREPDTLRQIAADSPTSIDGKIQRGYALADLGRWPEAESVFNAVLTEQPDAASARLGLAMAALAAGKADQAAGWLAKAPGADPELLGYAEAGVAIARHDFSAALARLEALSSNPALRQPASWLILADIHVYAGRLDEALAQIDKGLGRFPNDARLLSEQARIHLLADRPAQAVAVADQALALNPGAYEAHLVRGDIARREGDVTNTFKAYDAAIALRPEDPRAWYGRGASHGEREFIRNARRDLGRALELNPLGTGYQGERGTLETLANELDAAAEAFDLALQQNPSDFVSLTGQGLQRLKRGEPEQALQDFLRAGLMEPRYARVHVYTAVAYYQLGFQRQALEELARASELDDKDPLPYLMAGIIHTDQWRPGEGMDAARAALARLPYLKSLNQVANDQQGSANLGQAFAALGLEDWAKHYAQDAYSPFQASSHLFLADRYSGLFNKNSELFQGLISDPTVFGASNRFQSLIPAPGHHQSLSYRYTTSEGYTGNSPMVELNGYAVTPAPWAYYLSFERMALDFDVDGPYDLDTWTAALGTRPRHDIGVFAFLDHSQLDAGVAGPFTDLSDALTSDRADLGVHYKLSPESQFWFKASLFASDDDIDGILNLQLLGLQTEVDHPEVGFRHVFVASGGHEVSWGVDAGWRDTDSRLIDPLGFYPDFMATYRERSLDLYLSDVWRPSPRLTLQADLGFQSQRREARFSTEAVETLDDDALRPRLGVAWRPNAGMTLRLAYQDWMRPIAYSSLGPVETAGIPLDDRLVVRGGELQRLRGQFEWEASPSTFIMASLDVKQIDNHLFSSTPYTINELESLSRLRPRLLGNFQRYDIYEFISTPEYEAGDFAILELGVNQLLNRRWSVFARYVNSSSENTGALYPGLDIPYVPEHALDVGATWVHPNGITLTTRLTWRDERYADVANERPLDSGWNGDIGLYWQSRDKRWLLRASAHEILDPSRATQYVLEANYRF